MRQPIDLQSLEKWIDKNVPEIKTPLELKQFGFGQSNPTYLITSKPTSQQYVMRKKPPGKIISKTAHQVDREYRIIHALNTKTDVPTPKAYCLCEDDSIIGTAFYIMEFLDGRMVTEPVFPSWSASDRLSAWRSAITTLAKFHKVDYDAIGLSDFGRHNGFYDRQIKTFTRLSPDQAAARDKDTDVPVGAIPHFDGMIEFFKTKARQPKDRSTLIHGDYKIDNLVFHKTEPRVIGILDWEMATIGHPLSDLVNLTGPWSWTSQTAQNPQAMKSISAGAARDRSDFEEGVTAGLPTLRQAVQWYTEASGYEAAPDLAWGNAFGGFRGAIIMQGIAARYAVRQASGVTAKNYAAQMGPYGEWAWVQVEAVKRTQDEKDVKKAKL